jgi:hypothetical protein
VTANLVVTDGGIVSAARHRPTAAPVRTGRLAARLRTAATNLRLAVAAAILGVGLIIAAPFSSGAGATGAIVVLPGDVASACAQQLASAHPGAAARGWLKTCVTAMSAPTSSPTGTPSASPTPSGTGTPTPTGTATTPPPSPTPTVTPTTPSPTPTTPSPTPTTPSPTPTTPSPTPTTPSPSPTIGPTLQGCPAFPAMPDGSCTGWRHTGVTLHPCDASAGLNPGIYDSCLFTGAVNVNGPGVVINRSEVDGVVEYRYGDSGSLRGITLTDVEIDAHTWLGPAAIGNNDFTCTRCNIHGGTRGAGIGSNVVIQDSYIHDFTYTAGDHQTAVGSNGGAHNRFIHNWLICSNVNDPTNFGCSAALSLYGDDGPNDDYTIQYNRLDSGSSYCAILGNTPAKPGPATNIDFEHNVFGDMFTAYWHVPAHSCSQYGPYQAWDGTKAGNVFAFNVDVNGLPE